MTKAEELLAQAKAADVAKTAPTTIPTQVPPGVAAKVETVTVTREVDSPATLAKMAEMQAKLDALASENADLHSKMPIDNLITLRGKRKHFAAVLNNKRYLFREGIFRTADPELAHALVANFQDITQDEKHGTVQ